MVGRIKNGGKKRRGKEGRKVRKEGRKTWLEE